MKIGLIRDHVLGKKGDTISVSQPRGDYLIRMGVAKLHVVTVEVEQEKEEEEEKPKPKKATKRKTKTKK